MKGFGGTDRLAASDTLSDTNAFTHLGGLSALFRATQEEEEELFLKEKKINAHVYDVSRCETHREIAFPLSQAGE